MVRLRLISSSDLENAARQKFGIHLKPSRRINLWLGDISACFDVGHDTIEIPNSASTRCDTCLVWMTNNQTERHVQNDLDLAVIRDGQVVTLPCAMMHFQTFIDHSDSLELLMNLRGHQNHESPRQCGVGGPNGTEPGPLRLVVSNHGTAPRGCPGFESKERPDFACTNPKSLIEENWA